MALYQASGVLLVNVTLLAPYQGVPPAVLKQVTFGTISRSAYFSAKTGNFSHHVKECLLQC